MPEIFIQVDNPARSYFPGQTITGKVVTCFTKAKDKCSNLSVTIEGKARVYWTESHTVTEGTGNNKRRVTRTQIYTSSEDYFNAQLVLITGDGNLTIPSGNSAHQFQFMLPQNLPSSYTSDTGKVMYFMTARLKRSWNRFDITCTLPFTINGVLDLNKEIGATQQITLNKDKTICCCCCKSGPVAFKLYVPRTGFVPGESIPIIVEMTNMSRRKVNKSTIKLIQTVTCHAQGMRRQNMKTLCTATGPGIDRGESETWNTQSALRIPPVPPTRLAGCHIIDCDYSLAFTMEISGITSNLRVQFPITIGTIPLRQFFVDLMPSSGRQDLNGVPDYNQFLPSFPGAGPSHSDYSAGNPQNYPTAFAGGSLFPSGPIFDAYPDLPPPTYAEAVSTDPVDSKSASYENKSMTADSFDTKSKEASDGEPTAPPPEYDFSNDATFVPNYISYGFVPRTS